MGERYRVKITLRDRFENGTEEAFTIAELKKAISVTLQQEQLIIEDIIVSRTKSYQRASLRNAK